MTSHCVNHVYTLPPQLSVIKKGFVFRGFRLFVKPFHWVIPRHN